MAWIEDDSCVGCTGMGLDCIHPACGNGKYRYCECDGDNCNKIMENEEDVYERDGKYLCRECFYKAEDGEEED